MNSCEIVLQSFDYKKHSENSFGIKKSFFGGNRIQMSTLPQAEKGYLLN